MHPVLFVLLAACFFVMVIGISLDWYFSVKYPELYEAVMNPKKDTPQQTAATEETKPKQARRFSFSMRTKAAKAVQQNEEQSDDKMAA